jgi:long-chain acyl-CoA synthetase
MARKTGRLAGILRRAGVGAGVQVALSLPNSPAYIAWYFAVLEAGGIVVPLAPSLTAHEAREIVEVSGVRFVAASTRDWASCIPDVARVAETFDTGEGGLWRLPRSSPAIDTVPWTDDGVMLRHFTSGSTGRPKHMLKTEATVAFDLGTFRGNLRTPVGLGRDDVFLGALPLHTIYGAKSFTAAFSLGARVSILPRFVPGAVIETVARDRVTAFLATPSMIETLGGCFLEPGEERALRTLRYCGSSGAGLQAPVHDSFVTRFGVPIHNNYGTTETMSVAADTDDGFEEGRVGRPYPGVEIRIFDDDGNVLPACRPGQIGIKSPGNTESYVADPEASAKLFRNGYVFPADRGFLDDSGRLHLVGRDDVINIDGMKVDPLEVELVIRQSLPVTEVVVLAAESAGIARVRAVIEADPKRVTRRMVVEACRARLSPHKVPSLVEIRQRLPRTETGKIVRTSLRQS